MIRQKQDGRWLAKCDLCQWKTLESEKKDVENKLSTHINMAHKKGVKNIKKQKGPISPDKTSPNLPQPINERT